MQICEAKFSLIPTGEGMGDQLNCILVTWDIRIWDSHGFVNVAKLTHATPHEHHSRIHVLILGHTPQPQSSLNYSIFSRVL